MCPMDFSFYTQDVVFFYSVLTVLGQLIAVAAIVLLLLSRSGRKNALGAWISAHGLGLMFTVALLATLGSLFFSDIAGWNPCKDCWFQRIFMYPQVVLLFVAMWKRDKAIAPYILAMCLIGMVIAAFHYAEQVELALHPVDPKTLIPCDSSGESCAATQIHFTFGYITIPMMALTAFILNALGTVFVMRAGEKRGVLAWFKR